MNYTLNSIRINSNWFDNEGRKVSVYDKIGYEGLNLYFQLYKFRLHRQQNEHTFMTSISMLRKETGYTTNEIFELLKKMKAAKIIELENVSRWDYLIDTVTKAVKDKDIIHINALDTFPIDDYSQQDERYYIFVPLDLIKKYKEKGLNEKYYALYCLIKKWSQNMEEKMYMSISKMATILGFDKDYVHQMIYNLNRYYFMSSYKRKRASGHGHQFEHHILDSVKANEVEKFMQSHKGNMDKLIARLEKRKGNKKSIDIENEFEVSPNEPNDYTNLSYDEMLVLQS